MISVLQQQMGASAPQEARTPASPQPSPLALSESADYEIVLGRGQVASTMLLVLVVLVVFSGGGYVIGKSASPKVAVVQAAAPAAAPLLPATPEIAKAVSPVAKTPDAPPPVASKPLSAELSAPLYGEQVQGKVYLQVGAVEKGLAAIWAEGLRTHALSAFVAPGPSDKVWRVVIGPLPTPESFQQAKTTLDQLGINTFGRKQQ